MKSNRIGYFSILIIIFLSWSFKISGQDFGSLRGLVTDSLTGEPLTYCNILLPRINIGTTTGANGYFLIRKLPANSMYEVRISYVGYKPVTTYAVIKPNKITEIKVKLIPTEFELQTIEKISTKYSKENATDLSVERISIKNIESLPKGVETDIFRSLQYLPGIQSTGDMSARYYVRGGANNQNLVMINEIPIYNPFHALGMFSVFDPEMIKSIDFYKGGFPSRFAGRLSSVLNIITKEGSKNKFKASASGSFLTVKGHLEGPIPHGSFITSFRKNHSDEILKKFSNDENVPANFYDLTFRLNYQNDKVLEDGKFTLFGFFTGDKLDYNNPLNANYNWENIAYGINYFQMGDGPLFYEIKFFVSKFSGKVNPNKSGLSYQENELKDFTIQSDFTYVFDSKDELSVGSKIHEVHTSLSLENNLQQIDKISDRGANISVYGEYKFLRHENFGFTIGTRVNLSRMASVNVGVENIEPRMSLTYRPINWLAIKAAFGAYNQELVTISDENQIYNIFEPWIITPDYMAIARATHYIFGLEFSPHDNFNAKLEGYYKYVKNLPLINERKFFPDDKDLVKGKSKAYGFESMLQYKNNPFRISFAYTLGWVTHKVYGIEYYPRYDSRHNINFAFEVNVGKGWKASTSWFYNSGSPFTKVKGFYQKYSPKDFTNDEFYNAYVIKSIYSEKNKGRLPDYHRMDISISKKFTLGNYKFTFDASIINLYDRKNIFYFKRDTGTRVNMLPFLPTATLKVEL